MNVVILLGAPGSGKGTLAAELARVPGIRHLSSGDLLRGAVKQGTPAGLQAKAYMDAGNLVPDALIAQMVEEVLDADPATHVLLLDGFPRTLPQADLLGDLLARLATLPPKREGHCDACGAPLAIRKDDDPATVRHRLDVYARETFPLIDYYRQRGLLHAVDASGHDLEPKIEAALRKIHD